MSYECSMEELGINTTISLQLHLNTKPSMALLDMNMKPSMSLR